MDTDKGRPEQKGYHGYNVSYTAVIIYRNFSTGMQFLINFLVFYCSVLGMIGRNETEP